MLNGKSVSQQLLLGSAITLIAVGSVVLGTSFDSSIQSNTLKNLSKHQNLKAEVGELKLLANIELDLNDPLQNDANNFVSFLNVVFSGDKIIEGPMWINWNYKLSKFMSLSHNREKYKDINFKTCFKTLLENPKTKEATEKIKVIQPIFNKFRLINEDEVGFIVGISFLSISAIPLTILFALAIKSRRIIKEDEY